MSKQKGSCKGICENYIAKKPVQGGRYESGQVRCQICAEFMTQEGVKDNGHCKCCNYKVRTKPRNTHIKEKYHEAIKKNQEEKDKQETDNSITKKDADEEKNTLTHVESDDTAKSDGVVKTYVDLKNFLDLEVDIKNNHQIIILKELVVQKKLHEGKLAESMTYFNNRNPLDVNEVTLFLNTISYDNLLKRKIIKNNSDYNQYMSDFSLNAKFTESQEVILVEQLDRMLETYNSKYNIPNNEFPNAENMGNINWKYDEN